MVKFRVVHDLPILDIVAVVLAVISLVISILIATGMIGIHEHVKAMQPRSDTLSCPFCGTPKQTKNNEQK